MTERTRRWLIALAVLGLGASVAATWVHYQLLSNPGYTSFCDVSSTVNCTEACPRGIEVTKAIQEVKRSILFERF